MKIHSVIKKYRNYLKLICKSAFFIVLSMLIATSGLANIRKRRPPKELPKHLVKLQDDLIIEVDKAEELIYERGALYQNKEAIEYVNLIGRKLAPEVTLDEDVEFDFKIIRDPTVNAFALPNGSIYIHTGTLARLENESQLAFLLGHEMSHVVHRDSVYGTHSYHKKTIVYKLVDIALAPTSIFFGVLGDLAQLGFGILHISTVTGYSREVETRADEDAILWTGGEGYHPYESMGILRIFLDERQRYQTGAEIFFLMNHPVTEARLKRLKKIITKEYGETATGDIYEDEFLAEMVQIKLYNTSLNIKMDRLDHANDNVKWVLEKFPKNPEAHYLLGEIYRLKAEDKNKLKYELNAQGWKELNKDRKKGELEEIWQKSAVEEYNAAIGCDENYANSYKGLGQLYYNTGGKELALQYFEKYLEVDPSAYDKRYIRSLIKRINKPEEEV